MLSKVLVLSALVAVVLSATVPQFVPIVSQESEIEPDGTYQWSFEAGDGTHQEQNGFPLPIDKGEIAEQVVGEASWTDPEGGKHELSYTADENGYQPVGSDVPEIPAAIQKSLEWNEAHPEPKQ